MEGRRERERGREGEREREGGREGEREREMFSCFSLYQPIISNDDKVTRQCPQTTTCEVKGEPKRTRTEVLLLTSLRPYP